MMDCSCQVLEVKGVLAAKPMGGISRIKEGNPVSEELDPASGEAQQPCDELSGESLRALDADGSQRLWIAVLAQAFHDYYGYNPSEGPVHYRQLMLAQCRRSAKAWFLS